MGNAEIRLESEPFPLFPGEELETKEGKTVFFLEVIPAGNGLHVRCVRDFVNENGQSVCAGSEWLERGPKTYTPRVEVVVVKRVAPETIAPNSALRVKARYNFVDQAGTSRTAGESWLVKTLGSYLPSVEEDVEGLVQGVVLDKKKALQLRALQTFTDVYGKQRKAGDSWLVTHADAPVHIVDVMEEEVAQPSVVALTAQQYCVVVDMVDGKGRNRYGYSEIVKGPRTFFLQPGETLRGGVQSIIVVNKDEALLLKALSTYRDGRVERTAGTTWMLHGPAEYVPLNNVEILERRKMIALDQNEGIYVMDVKKGTVRAVIGKPYMPNENEILWEKHLPGDVEELLTCPGGSRKRQRNPDFVSKREKHHIVRFNVQHNAAVQIYDYKMKKQRIVMGPDLVILAPHEEFTVLSLSGGKPKVPNALQSLQLFLGPRFSSDTVIVETSDHARLSLRLSYNWYFDVTKDKNGEYSQKTFSVPDFIGDCCKTIASRVRGAVAAEDFDSFHRNSTKIIRTAVFGVDANGEVRRELRFVANDFVVTNIDVQSVEPTDEKTRDSLQKSVQLAIEITTKSQEAAARHGNELKDQEAKGKLERQKIADKIEVENAKTKWLELQAKSEAVQASGQSVAEAKAKAEALLIEVNSELQQAKLRAQAYLISAEAELKKLEQPADHRVGLHTAAEHTRD
ncbi:major vault protein [Strigomonas culicis]|uniref:Major vault protein n=1 Tax=Strigomonas culicis TaxID=28005 RepID=S9UWG8_9TRYP|nr:major vault protein [Strigomonas culicis]|eukprot:EPY18881.1 major vault protein [Strigomonas culicis]